MLEAYVEADLAVWGVIEDDLTAAVLAKLAHRGHERTEAFGPAQG